MSSVPPESTLTLQELLTMYTRQGYINSPKPELNTFLSNVPHGNNASVQKKENTVILQTRRLFKKECTKLHDPVSPKLYFYLENKKRLHFLDAFNASNNRCKCKVCGAEFEDYQQAVFHYKFKHPFWNGNFADLHTQKEMIPTFATTVKKSRRKHVKPVKIHFSSEVEVTNCFDEFVHQWNQEKMVDSIPQ